MNIYNKFYVDYDRSRHDGGRNLVADMLISTAHDAEGLYVDFYAMPDELASLPPNQFVSLNSAATKPGVLSKLLNIKAISAYVCVRVDSAEQLKALWNNYSYSSPMLYRVSKAARTAREAALDDILMEKFQWASLDELAILLETNTCVFRDMHDEVGLEVLCLASVEQRIKHLISIYLSVD